MNHTTPRHACRLLLLLVLVAIARAAPADGAPQPKAEKPTELVLEVDPAAEPIPAFKYHLLVPAEARIEGNAAPIYGRLLYERTRQWSEDFRDELSRYLDVPAEELPLEEIRKLLERLGEVTDQLAAAARRSDCHWEYVFEGQDPVMILLPDAQFLRNYARLLAVKARYETQTGELAAAVGSVRDGLALGQHAADAPFLVNQFVGAAISDVMLSRLDELIARPGAPNLYWALAALPRPLVSLRRGVASECAVLVLKFPVLARLDDPDAPPDWQRLARQLRAWAAEIVRMDAGAEGAVATLARIGAAATPAQLADARAYLRDKHQRPAAEVEAMSEAEVEVRYTLALFREIGDAWRKWFCVPYPQAAQFRAHGDALLAEARRREFVPLVSILLPLGGNLLAPQLKLDRQVARLQTIEAVRMHAAATGKLPEKLDQVTVVPVPLDPLSGGPFRYTLEGDTATLDVTDGTDLERENLRVPVQIRLRGK